VLTLDADGKLFLQHEEIQLNQVLERLVPVVCLQPMNNRKVFLKVDGELAHQKAVDVLDKIRLASDQAKHDTALDPTRGGDGGDVKVIIALKKV
jgi:biopolymer transport protein ExbD